MRRFDLASACACGAGIVLVGEHQNNGDGSVNILVTGGTGFLGTAIVKRLVANGDRVVSLGSRDANLFDDKSLLRFRGERFDQIWHLAAWTQAGNFCLTHQGEQWINNQKINTNVLDFWRVHQPQAKLVAMGTSCAYPPNGDLTEDRYLEGEPIDSLFTYAHTKRMLYIGLRALQAQFGLTAVCLVPSTLYGPGYHTDGRQMHFVFDLIRKILIASKGGPPPVLWGDGYQKRELIFIDDFVDAAISISGRPGLSIVNVGSGEEYSIREFAQAICDAVGYDYTLIEFDSTQYVGARSKVLDVKQLKSLLPHWSLTPLVAGLRHTIAWFESNWHVLRSVAK